MAQQELGERWRSPGRVDLRRMPLCIVGGLEELVSIGISTGMEKEGKVEDTYYQLSVLPKRRTRSPPSRAAQ